MSAEERATHIADRAAGHDSMNTGVVVTTDPDSFDAEHTFDLGHPSVVEAYLDVTAFDGDGEAAGAVGVSGAAIETSPDGVVWAPVAGQASYPDFVADGLGLAPGDRLLHICTYTPRYLRVGVAMVDAAFNTYAGANHPVASVEITAHAH